MTAIDCEKIALSVGLTADCPNTYCQNWGGFGATGIPLRLRAYTAAVLREVIDVAMQRMYNITRAGEFITNYEAGVDDLVENILRVADELENENERDSGEGHS